MQGSMQRTPQFRASRRLKEAVKRPVSVKSELHRLSPCHGCPRPLPLDCDLQLSFHYLQFYFRLDTPDHAVNSARDF